MTRPTGLLVLAATLLVTGCFLFPREEEKLAPPLMEPPKVTYETIEAKKTTIVDDFRVSAVLRYTQQQNLYFRYGGGRLLKISVASGDRVRAGELLAELDSDALKFEVARQEIELQKAHLVADRAAVLGRDKYEQQAAQLDVKEAELTLENDRTQLAKAQLVAPMDGVVDYLSNLGEGDAVDAYRTVMRVADPRVIDISYQGERAGEFTFGMTVEVTYKERTYVGTVVRATSTAPADASEDEKGAVIVHVKNLPGGAQSGDPAQLRVVLQRRDNVIVIPRNLVQTYQGANYVDLLKDGVRRQQPVEQGIVTTTEAEIVKGLSPGDQVIVR